MPQENDNPTPTSNPADNTLIRELVGLIWVDSGQIVVADPDYAADLDPEQIDAATDRKKRSALIGEGLAAVIRTGVRTGRYPVYVTRFENGAVARIEIELAEQTQA